MLIKPSEIHVWTLPLLDSPADFGAADSVLSGDEVMRVRRYHRSEDASRYARSRIRLRKLIEGYTGIPAKDITFSYGAYGKPGLSPVKSCPDIRFGVSHTSDITLFAFAVARDVGVDVESTAVRTGLQDDISRLLSTKEKKALHSAPPDQRDLLCLRYWTRKEACLKLLGAGLSVGLETVDVSTPPSALVDSGSSPGEPHRHKMLWVSDLELDERHVGALALAASAEPAKIRYLSGYN